MSILCPDQIVAGIKNRVVFVAQAIPFSYPEAKGLPSTTLEVKASREGRVKVYFGICSYVVVNTQELQNSQEDLEFLSEDPQISERERIAIALVASVIEGFKSDIFPGLKIGKTIEEIKLVDQGIIFTTLRLKSVKEGEEKYKILVLKRAGRTGKYEQDNLITFSILRKKETIEIELGSQGASRNDTIEIRAILNAVLGKLGENSYLIYEPEESHGRPGKWTFYNFRPTD